MTLGGSTVDVPLSTRTVLATRDELFSTNEQLPLAGFLAGYSGLTRDAYTLDLRQYVTWCTEHRVAVCRTRRADIECFARHLESLGRARATIARRLCTVSCFYRYAEQEGLIAVSPAAHVRRPRLDYESHATGLDRNEVGAMLVAAGLAGSRAHQPARPQRAAGLRSHRRRHRRPWPGTRPPHPHDPAERGQGRDRPPCAPDGPRHRPGYRRTLRGADLHRSRRQADRPSHRRSDRAPYRPTGGDRQAGGTAHTLRDAFITAALDAGVPLRDVQEVAIHADPRTTMRYDRARVSLDRHATYIVATFLAGASR
jgi:integrase/recombinase XerD